MNRNIKFNLISVLLSVASVLLISIIFLAVIGKNPFSILGLLLSEVFGSGYGFGQTLFKATPLIITGCGLAVCFHASLFNIGAEGQLNAGSFVIGILALHLTGLSFWASFPICLLSGFAVSALVGFIPAVIKIKKGVSEVITTIMLNFIVLGLINYFLLGFMAAKGSMHSEKIPESFMLPMLSQYISVFEGSSVNVCFFFAIIVAIILYFYIYKTKTGYRIRAIGYNETASKYIGIKVKKLSVSAFMLGAGITSLAGINFIMGYKGYYEFGFSNNLGFTAIAVALLAKNNPIGIIFSGLLFGILDYGGLAINQDVPKELMLVVQALIVIAIIVIDKLVEKYKGGTLTLFKRQSALAEEV